MANRFMSSPNTHRTELTSIAQPHIVLISSRQTPSLPVLLCPTTPSLSLPYVLSLSLSVALFKTNRDKDDAVRTKHTHNNFHLCLAPTFHHRPSLSLYLARSRLLSICFSVTLSFTLLYLLNQMRLVLHRKLQVQMRRQWRRRDAGQCCHVGTLQKRLYPLL